LKMSKLFSIDTLVEELVPVRVLRAWHALALTAVATVVASAGVIYRFGLRTDLAHGVIIPMVLLRGGALLLLGTAALLAVVNAGRPAVGRATGHTGWRWALAMAALFPVSALLLWMQSEAATVADLHSGVGMYCLSIGGGAALLIGTALTLWLRRGAATSPHQAGWLTGLTAGSLGTFAFSLHCPVTGIYYIGFWYSLTVALCAVIGRIVVPHLIRW
jgi:hypothetical protein